MGYLTVLGELEFNGKDRMADGDLNGIATLDVDAPGVPDGGVSRDRHRVEVQRESCTESWIAEITVKGDLPWRRGESRPVGLRILSTEFRAEVCQARPALVMMRGSFRIGLLKLDVSPREIA
jgi:hypothetical protein